METLQERQTVYRESGTRFARTYFAILQANQSDYAYLEEKLANLLHAFDLAERYGMYAEYVQFAMQIYRFLIGRGRYADAHNLLTKAANLGSVYTVDIGLGEIAFYQAVIYRSLGKLDQARAKCDECLSWAFANDDHLLASRAQGELGNIELELGNYPKAAEILQDACNKLESLNAVAHLASALNSLAATYASQGKLVEAQALWERSIHSPATSPEEMNRQSNTLANLGLSMIHLGNYAQAQQYLDKGLELARYIKSPVRIVRNLTNLGVLAEKQDKDQDAHNYWAEALHVCQIHHLSGEKPAILNNLSVLYQKQQRYSDAINVIKEGIAVYDAIEVIGRKVGLYLNYAIVLLASKSYDELPATIETGLQLSEAANSANYQCGFRVMAGEYALIQQETEEAITAFSIALALAESHSYREWKGNALFGLAQAHWSKGEHAIALDFAHKSLAVFEAMSHHKHKEVREWIDRHTTDSAAVKLEP